MPRHLLVLEGLSWGLALSRRAVAAVRDRDAVAGAQAAKIVPLHRAGKPLADADADHIDTLAGDKMPRGDLGAGFEERVVGDAEFGEPRLRLDLCLGKMATLRLRDV